VDILQKLLVETPVDKKAVEEVVQALRKFQMMIGQSIYK
jgi:hypothetical protein